MPGPSANRIAGSLRVAGWLAALTFAAAGAAAEPFGYVYGEVPGGDQGLLQLDLETGDLTPVGPFGLPGAVRALALAPDGALYGIEDTGPRLIRIDVATGAAQVVAALDFSEPYIDLSELTFDACGRLFATGIVGLPPASHPLLEIALATGAVTERTAPGSDEVFSVAARGEELFVWTADGLARIEPETHLPVQVGPLPDELGGPLDFDDTGVLWGYGLWPPGALPNPLPNIHVIHQIDPEAGAASEPIATLPSSHGGLAIAPPPGSCLSGTPLAVPALSTGGIAVLVLSLLALGIFLLRRGAEAAGSCS